MPRRIGAARRRAARVGSNCRDVPQTAAGPAGDREPGPAMTAPSDDEALRIRLALEDLNSAFTYHLDHDEVDALVALFTDNAVYTHGRRRSEGKAEIAALFRSRTAAGPRTARHIQSGLRIEIESAARARGTSVVLTFAADGEPPLRAVPHLVADFDDVYERGPDGRWRIAERHISRIFVAEGNPGPIGYRQA